MSGQKVVNSWNEWDPLKRVIVGRSEGTNIPAPEPAWWYDQPEGGFPLGQHGPFPQDMVDKANAQMDDFVQVLEGRGIIVDRVPLHPMMYDRRAVSTPDWVQLSQHGVNNPRDVFVVVGNEIMEATASRRSRWYEYLNLRPLFEQYFKEDPDFLWTAAPKPRLTDESYVKNYYYLFNNVWTDEEKRERMLNWEFHLTEKEPLWDGADAARMGKDIFWQCSSLTNKSGMDWLRRYFGAKGIRVHPVLFDDTSYHQWHIDVNLLPLRPGLAVYNEESPPITEEALKLFKMNDWELIPAAKPVYVHKSPVRLFGPYGGTSWISMNTLSLGPNTICVESHETGYMEQLDKLGFEVVPITYEHVIPFGGALHCTTLDVCREGDCEDYFPKQIPGY
jgi:glycine amidinotransferase